MSKLRLKISMSLDGFVAGPSQSLENPLGIGGMRLHEWVFPLAVWRAMHGLEGGETNESTPVIEESPANHPVFVLTRHARAPLLLDGGTSFTFVTEGIEAALSQARAAARGPVLLRAGERLFQDLANVGAFEHIRTVAAPKVTHLKFARR